LSRNPVQLLPVEILRVAGLNYEIFISGPYEF